MITSNSPVRPRILVVDDAGPILEDFRKILAPSPTTSSSYQAAASRLFGDAPPEPAAPAFDLECVAQGQLALAAVERAQSEQRPFAVAFVDMRMPTGWDGLETIRHLSAADPELQFVICTAYSDYSWDEMLRAIGQSDRLLILKKPFDNIEVLQIAHALSKKWEITRRDRERLLELDRTVEQRTTEVRHAEERFSQAFDGSPVPQAIQDLETRHVVGVNAAYEKFTGLRRADVVGRTPDGFGHHVDPADEAKLLRSLKLGEAVEEWPFAFTSPDGSPRQCRCNGRAVVISGRPCAIWGFRDVTEQVQLEHQFRQAQKMEAVGQLAAGVAHDFNNLLTVILSYTSSALDEASLPAQHRSGLKQVLAAAHRAASLTRQLLVFSRRQIASPEPLDVGLTLNNLKNMLCRLVPERIRLVWNCPANLRPVLADAANLEQVVMNLVVNARDAIASSGVIRLSLRETKLAQTDTIRHPDARAGDFLCLSVSDSGAGMSPEVLSRAFEPFFTTKAPGDGTGLGLSTVYGIVHQHEGWIEVESTPGRGTTFSIFLPTLREACAPIADASGLDAIEQGPARGERVLLVEDEPLVRETALLIASRAGYRVTATVDGPTALQAWSAATEPFDVLLTDMVMPNGMTGLELAKTLRAENPALKIVLSTGYSDDLVNCSCEIEGAWLLQKPYEGAKLLETLRKALSGRGGG